jgi:hypothetical protein
VVLGKIKALVEINGAILVAVSCVSAVGRNEVGTHDTVTSTTTMMKINTPLGLNRNNFNTSAGSFHNSINGADEVS